MNHKINTLSLALLVKHLVDGPTTIQEAVDAVGVSRPTVGRFLRALVKAKGAHVSAWEEDRLGRQCVPVFSLGPGTQAPRRKATNAMRRAKYVAKMKEIKRLQLMAGTITTGEENEDRNRVG